MPFPRAINLFNQQQSWDRAFTYNGSEWIAKFKLDGTGSTFSNGYRYLNWAIDVPMLLLQILFVVPVAAAGFKKLAVGFGASGLLDDLRCRDRHSRLCLGRERIRLASDALHDCRCHFEGDLRGDAESSLHHPLCGRWI